MSIGESLSYRSPISKLLPFFRRSRDNWKAKCIAAKQENKSLKYRLAAMTEKRNRWKAEVRDLQKCLQVETMPSEPHTKKLPAHGSRGRPCRHSRPGARSPR